MDAADDALSVVGGYRPWHLAMFFSLGMSSFIGLCWQQLVIVFQGWGPPHHCSVPEGHLFNDTIPFDDDGNPAKCIMYANLTVNNNTIECTHGWTYEKGSYNTIVNEWDLVCNKDYLAELSQTLFQVGGLIGELCLTTLVDKVGRRPVHMVGLVATAVFGCAIVLAQDYITYAILRTILCIIIMPTVLAGETMMIEMFSSSERAFAGVGLEIQWCICYLLLGLFAWCLTDWRHLQLTISLLNLIFVFYIWCLPESVYWLTVNNKTEEAENTLQKMAKWNGIKLNGPVLTKKDLLMNDMKVKSKEMAGPIDDDYEVKVNDGKAPENEPISDKDADTGKFLDLFRDRILLKHTIVSGLFWFANCVVYYGLILSSPSMPGDRFVNFSIGGIVEIPAVFVCYFLVLKSRRWTTCISHIFAGIFLIILAFTPAETASGQSLAALHIVLSSLGRFCISISFGAIVLYTKEIFPTNLRATSCGITSILGRVGNMVAPFLAYAARHIPWLTNIIMAVVSILMGLLTLVLPETAAKSLPQTIQATHDLYVKEPAARGGSSPKKSTASVDEVTFYLEEN